MSVQKWGRRLRPVMLAGVVLLIIGKIVFLSPSQLEESQAPPKALEPSALLDPDRKPLASGIPLDKVPDYSIEQFTYLSTHNGEKEWNLNADQAFMFNATKLVHSKNVKALLYDTDGNTTLVTGREAKYQMNDRDLEIYGDVVTTLPDGFVIKSEYMSYKPQTKQVSIPAKFDVAGAGKEEGGEDIHFTSRGLEFNMVNSEIFLPSSVRLTTIQTKDAEQPTTIISDQCKIHRKQRIAYFTMYSSRPASTRFVEIEQPSTWGKGRTADLNYGSAPQVLQYLTLHDDVSIKDLNKNSDSPDKPARTGSLTAKNADKNDKDLKYATGGRADFDSHKDIVILTDYPQIYQDNDTVTGDTIIMHRDTDIIEVEHSNAFKQGS